ncbi:efflux RND transporter periplasmic adaptor subunit [Wenyingzhuangia sp. IMCC45574]
MDIKLEKKKGLKPKQYGYIVLVVFILFLMWKAIFGVSVATFKIEKEKLSIATVIEGDFDDYITINGMVAPISTVYMDAYEGGRITEKFIEEGAMVKKGDVILKLENRGLYEQILASENNLALKQNDLRSTKITFDSRQADNKKELIRAEYQLKRLKRNYEQQKALYDEALISRESCTIAQENYEQAAQQYQLINLQATQFEQLRKTTLNDLDLDLARMKKTLSMVYERIDHLNVRAPSDGQLGFLDGEIGQSIGRGKRIGQINILTNFKIEAEIDEHYIDRVKRGLLASFERNEEEYGLKIKKVYPEVRNGTFKVDLVFTGEKPATIRAGQSYHVKLQLGASNRAKMIPRGGFFQSTGGQWVFVLDPTGERAIKRTVKIGKQNSRYYELLSGLDAGEAIISSSYDSFGEVEQIVFK